LLFSVRVTYLRELSGGLSSATEREPYLHGDRDPLLSQRAALILLLGVLVSIGAGVLTAWGGSSPQTAVLAGGTAFPVTVGFFHSVIG
jgi:hypothetical protein